jgi:hypothetical protein
MKTWKNGEKILCILNLILGGGKWSDSSSDHFTPDERASNIYCTGGSVGLTVNLDGCGGKEKNSLPW